MFVINVLCDMKRIVVASDSFKGSLTSLQVADAVESGIRKVYPVCEVVKVNVADGGEGTMDSLHQSLGGTKVKVPVRDPLGRWIDADYLIMDDGVTAVVEMSRASGLTLVGPSERNPLKTSSFGTGQLVEDALSRGCRKFIVGIGGSATNDGGMGMLAALGVRFSDSDGRELLPVGENLARVVDIDLQGMNAALSEADFLLACDVDSPFCGPEGAAYVFAPQKGADADVVRMLDEGMRHYAEVLMRVTGRDIIDVPGSGAAGGLGGAFIAFFNAQFRRGVDLVLDILDFDGILSGTDLVITGEGRMDGQTLTGKTPYGVMLRAWKQGVPVVAVAGSVSADAGDIPGFDHILSVTPSGMSLSDAMTPSIAMNNISTVIFNLLSNKV